MMDAPEREQALRAMRASAEAFYRTAVQIGVHPFIEFAGLMNEYLLACAQAHAQGIDFSECNRHSGQALPLHPVMGTVNLLRPGREKAFDGTSANVS